MKHITLVHKEARVKEKGARSGENKKAPLYVFPKLRSMDDEINERYRSMIVSAVNHILSSGEICQMLGRTILTTGIADEECCFKGVSYYRSNIHCTIAEVTISLELTEETKSGDLTGEYTLYADLTIDADEDFEARLFRLESTSVGDGKWRMDNSLSPFISRKSADIAAAEILRKYSTQEPSDKTILRAKALAEDIGLEIKELPLAKSIPESYILFFEDSKVPVSPGSLDMELETSEPVYEKVSANTIVLNTNQISSGYGSFEIFQACFQYVWFYQVAKFNRLDCSLGILNDAGRVILLKQSGSASLMNSLCSCGALCLLLPKQEFKEKMFRAYRRACVDNYSKDYINHDGFRYNRVIFDLAKEFDVLRYRVRQRIIQLGEVDAMGANNYDPDLRQQFTPFAFDRNGILYNDSFYITRMQLYDIYMENAELRSLMHTGDYAFCDGLVCLNTREHLQKKDFYTMLSRSANARVDQCCLRFSQDYSSGKKAIRFDAKKHAEKYECQIQVSSPQMKEEMVEYNASLIANMPTAFGSALDYLMRNNMYGRFDDDKLAKATRLDAKYISRIKTSPTEMPSIENMIAICVALHLTPKVSDALLGRAGIEIERPSAEGYILDCLYMESVERVKTFLDENGFIDEDLPFEIACKTA